MQKKGNQGKNIFLKKESDIEMLLSSIQSTEKGMHVLILFTGLQSIETKVDTCSDTDMETSATLGTTPQFHTAVMYTITEWF